MRARVIPALDRLREVLTEARRHEKTIGLVPTMGALHAGHARLIERARSECDVLIVSIFLNPLQFGPDEDLERYPQDLEQDTLFCRAREVDFVFAPSREEMYPKPRQPLVEVGDEAAHLCGPFRPRHFRGVATVVLRLFRGIEPDRAYFGEKDIQQLAVISRMTRDLELPVEIVPVPTVREIDGLAVSSRNAYLNSEERRAASVLYRALRVARERIADGVTDPSVVREAALTVLGLEPLARVEYLEIVDSEKMQPVKKISTAVRVAAAVWIGQTRLIDNVPCEPGNRSRRRRPKPSQ